MLGNVVATETGSESYIPQDCHYTRMCAGLVPCLAKASNPLETLDELREVFGARFLVLTEWEEGSEFGRVIGASPPEGFSDDNPVLETLEAIKTEFRLDSRACRMGEHRTITLKSDQSEVDVFLQTFPEDSQLPGLVFSIGWDKSAGHFDHREFPAHLRVFLSLIVQSIRRVGERQAKKELETMLHQSQRLTSIGRLASGIAHDFNNLLTVIKGHTSFVESYAREKGNSKALESIRLIENATNHAVDLAKQLLLFSRKDSVSEFEQCDLNEIVSNFYKMMRRMVEENIEIEIDLDPAVGLINADRGMVGQILMNLIVNARDAMPDGGQIFLTTEPFHLDGGNGDLDSGDYVSLSVRDTGSGISPSNLKRIFDPFYSTKGKGKGTGLGLANVASLMRQHGGQIDVASVVGEGTCFELLFPQVAPRPEATEPETKMVEVPTRDNPADQECIQGSKVLLVEDEDAVRKLVRKLLEMHGCSVVEATSGKQALDLWPEVCDDISVVVTDVIMPEGVSGWDLAKELHSRAPRCRNPPYQWIQRTGGGSRARKRSADRVSPEALRGEEAQEQPFISSCTRPAERAFSTRNLLRRISPDHGMLLDVEHRSAHGTCFVAEKIDHCRSDFGRIENPAARGEKGLQSPRPVGRQSLLFLS